MYDDQADFIAWLSDSNAIHTVLIEAQALVNGAETTFYMSTHAPYSTGANDAPANMVYDTVATVGVLYTEQLSTTDSGATLSVGEIDIENYSGDRDAWATYVWTNRPLRAYIGDPRWPRNKFQPIFVGVVASIEPKDENTLVLKMRDKMQLLNTSVTEATIGGIGQNKDATMPTLLGECSNITPVLENEATLTWRYHGGGVAGPIEVRDGGVPVATLLDSANGRFTLEAQSFGNITLSAQGDSAGGYTNRIAPLIARLITNYGSRVNGLTAADIDQDNFDKFDAAHPQPVGIYLPDRTNVISACQDLASSVGAQLVPSRLGQFRLVQLAAPSNTPSYYVTADHILDGTFVPSPGTLPDVVASVKLGFCKNWTVQTDLTEKIPQAHRDLYAQEWLTATVDDPVVKRDRKLSGEPTEQDTMLLTRFDATAEALRRLNTWKVNRTAYSFVAVRALLVLELGQTINIVYRRYNMQNGVNATVISLAPDWTTGQVKVGILV